MNTIIKYLSLFSGIGGFERGIEQTNKKYQCIGYSEVDKYAESIYKRHYPNHTGFGDATLIQTEELPRFDLLVGGFPCQAFSHAGLRRGFDDTRGTLFFEISRILRDKRPQYFLLENVRGLLSHERGKTFQTMLRTLSKLGYDVQWQIYNSKDYGVPQNRERLYIKGYLREREHGRREILSERQDGTKTTATSGQRLKEHERGKSSKVFAYKENIVKDKDGDGVVRKPNHIGSVCKGIGGKVYDTRGISPTLLANGGGLGAKTGLYKVGNIRRNQRSESGDVYSTMGISPTLCARDYKDGKKVLIKGNISPSRHRSGDVNTPYPQLDNETIMLRNNTRKGYLPAKNGDGVVLDFANAKGRVQKQRSPTMTAHSNVGTVSSDLRVRRLTPLECERLQGFPDDWTRYGCEGEQISDTQRYKCIGNAVTTNVVQYIIENWEMTT